MTPITLRTLQGLGVVLSVLAVLVTTVVFPTLAPPTFLIACCVMLFIALWIHRSEFGVEQYERNTLKYTLRNSASAVVLLIAVFGIVGFWYFTKYNSAMVGPVPALPTLPIVGGGLDSVAKHAVSRIREVMRTGKL
jgi:uncharacterized membrane protein